MISETRERFLRAIVATIPPELIAEIHFFQPIKQGGVESGVAVVAAGEPTPLPPVHAPDDGAGARADAPPSPDVTEPAGAPDDVPHEAYAVRTPDESEPPAAHAAGDEPAAESAATLTPGTQPESHDHPEAGPLAAGQPGDDDDPYASTLGGATGDLRTAHRARSAASAHAAPSVTDDIPTTAVLDDLASGEELGAEATDAAPASDEAPPRRFTVFTARYRLVLKGLDRGKWEAAVVAEADAPLLTIEAVVRGVQRRSGDVDEAERMFGDDVRRELARMDAAAAMGVGARAR